MTTRVKSRSSSKTENYWSQLQALAKKRKATLVFEDNEVSLSNFDIAVHLEDPSDGVSVKYLIQECKAIVSGSVTNTGHYHWRFKLFGKSPSKITLSDGYRVMTDNAPHPNSGGDGYICLGEFEEYVNAQLKKMEFANVRDTLSFILLTLFTACTTTFNVGDMDYWCEDEDSYACSACGNYFQHDGDLEEIECEYCCEAIVCPSCTDATLKEIKARAHKHWKCPKCGQVTCSERFELEVLGEKPEVQCAHCASLFIDQHD
jgi:DNA-directed RNA polymerase subunit RPC12/RpoP